MRNFTATTTTTSAVVNGRSIISTPSHWKRGHNSRGSVGERIQVIPGFKTSAAFLTSLGANLCIDDSDDVPSPADTPSLRPVNTFDFHHNLPHQSPLATATMADNDVQPDKVVSEHAPGNNPLEGVPPLTTEIATEESDIVAALKLIADSVAQQRNVASRVLIFHPLNLAVFTVLFAFILQFIYKSPADLAKAITTATGVAMVALVTVRQYASPYIFEAEKINLSWLDNDQIIISRYGEEVIGALVLGWEKGEGRGNRRKKWGRGLVRAWTVRLRYRGKGVGSELLDEAARMTEKRGGEEMAFAGEHASKLPCWRSSRIASLANTSCHRFKEISPCFLQRAVRSERGEILQTT